MSWQKAVLMSVSIFMIMHLMFPHRTQPYCCNFTSQCRHWRHEGIAPIHTHTQRHAFAVNHW